MHIRGTVGGTAKRQVMVSVTEQEGCLFIWTDPGLTYVRSLEHLHSFIAKLVCAENSDRSADSNQAIKTKTKNPDEDQRMMSGYLAENALAPDSSEGSQELDIHRLRQCNSPLRDFHGDADIYII
jgi:hypothetical protein